MNRRDFAAAAIGGGLAAVFVYTSTGAAVTQPLSGFTPIIHTRILDTREGLGGVQGKAQPGQVVPVVSMFTNNSVVKALAVNVKMVNASEKGFITLWDGVGPVPTASTLDANGLSILNNGTVVLLDPFGVFRIFVSKDLTTDLAVDVVGFYSLEPQFAVGPPPVP